MICKVCHKMMKIVNFREDKTSVVYYWRCPICGQLRTSKEEK